MVALTIRNSPRFFKQVVALLPRLHSKLLVSSDSNRLQLKAMAPARIAMSDLRPSSGSSERR